MKERSSPVGLVLWHLACMLGCIITVTPFLWAVVSSFKPLSKIFADVVPFSWKAFVPSPFTVEAYVELFTNTGFLKAMANTFYVSFMVVVFGILLNALAGFAFAKLDFPGKNTLFVMVMFSFMIPFEAIAIPLYGVVRDLGWLNTYRALIIPGIANGLTVFMFRQFFAGIPSELMEAAVVDGASMLRIFATIFLPLSKPALVGAGLLLFVSQWEAFLWPLIAANTEQVRVIQVAIAYINTQFSTFWNQIFAGSVIAGLVPLLLIFPLQKYYVKGLSGTGIKG